MCQHGHATMDQTVASLTVLSVCCLCFCVVFILRDAEGFRSFGSLRNTCTSLQDRPLMSPACPDQWDIDTEVLQSDCTKCQMLFSTLNDQSIKREPSSFLLKLCFQRATNRPGAQFQGRCQSRGFSLNLMLLAHHTQPAAKDDDEEEEEGPSQMRRLGSKDGLLNVSTRCFSFTWC